MADWQTLTRRAAQQEHIDPALYQALVWKESRGKADARSPAGALGYSQLMPDTARGLGVDPSDPWQNLLGGARYLGQQLKAFGGDQAKALAAYNAGPGAVQKYGGVPPYAETQGYVKDILGSLGSAGASPNGSTDSAPAQGTPVQQPSAGLPQGADASALLALLGQQRGQPRPASSTPLPTPAAIAGPAMPDAYRALSSGGGPQKQGPDVSALLQAASTPGQQAADVAAQASPLVADASSAGGSAPPTGTGGAQAALGWAQSKVGFKETGANSGGLASYLNQRFGMSNQPWCAMFTSAAVTKGGAPAAARTASVAEVRRQAEQGGGGYQKGFVGVGKAQAGDLILFGNDHVGMVQRVEKGQVFYVGGNQSDGVTEASVSAGSGDIVRPKYGARKR